MKRDKEMSIDERIKYYFGLPYTIQLIRNEDGTYFASIKELPGCMTEGDTQQEALEMLDDAKLAWLEIAIEDGEGISLPESMVVKRYSGRFNVRLPKGLHRRLAEDAEAENVSLNSFVTSLLESGSTLKQLIRKKDEIINHLSIENYRLRKENTKLKQNGILLQEGMFSLSRGDVDSISAKESISMNLYRPLN